MSDYYCIVGDDYAAFADNTAVLTVTQLIQALRLRTVDPNQLELTPGLGLDDSELRAIQAALSGAGASLELVRRFEPAACDLRLTHKRSPEHVMIGPLRRTQPGEYVCQLRIDGQCDRLSDHTSGQHIAGMLLIEAARQAGCAILELEYNQGREKPWALAWHGLRVSFSTFAFPLPTELRLRWQEDHSKPKRNQLSVQLAVSVEQAGQSVTDLGFEVTLCDATMLNRLEPRAAARAVSRTTEPTKPASNACQFAS